MGNDGGSIPTRRELVKEGAKDLSTTQVKEIQAEQQEHFWSTCALSHEPLSQPVVSDALGSLYNKDAVLKHLIAEGQKHAETSLSELESKKETSKDRLRSLRDVVEVKFHTAPEDSTGIKFICPITNKILGPGTKAVYLVPCGHAFAESLMATIHEEKCLECDEPYSADNIIQILPTSEAVKNRLVDRIQNLEAKGLTHSLKKAPKDSNSKKRKKAGPVAVDGDTENGAAKVDISNGKTTNAGGIKNADTAALTEKVLKEQEIRNKRRKMAGNENVDSLFSKGEGMEVKKVDFMTRGFSIPSSVKR